MAGSNSTNQVPTSATNQQDATSGGTPNFAAPMQPIGAPAAPDYNPANYSQPPTPAPSNPFSAPSQQAPAPTPAGGNPFSAPSQQPAAPSQPATGGAPNPFTAINILPASGDFTRPTNQPGVFTNAQGFTSGDMAANAAKAVQLLQFAKSRGYQPTTAPALNQYAAGLLTPYEGANAPQSPYHTGPENFKNFADYLTRNPQQ